MKRNRSYLRDPIFQVHDYGRKGIPTRIFQEDMLVFERVSCDPTGASAEWISVMGLVELDFVQMPWIVFEFCD